jgi:5'-nucleotidase
MKTITTALALCLSMVLMGQDLVILHTNDMHSHVNGLSPESDFTPFVNDNDPTLGGFSRIAGFIKAEKKAQGDKLLVIDAGDFLMGTFYQTIEATQGFQLNLMKKMGYEFCTIGNHEFDFGPNVLADIIQNNKRNGEIPQILFANYASSVADDKRFTPLFNDGTILPYSIVEKNGHKIGLIGLMGTDAQESIDSKYGVAIEDPVKAAKRTVKYLKQDQKVEMVIAISHGGIRKNKKGEWGDDDVLLAKKVTDIDLIIGGHTHTILRDPLRVGNVVIVQTGDFGKRVGRVEVSFKPTGKPAIQAKLVEMNDAITADAEIQRLIDEKVPELEKNILSPFGISYSKPVVETAFELFMDDKNPIPSNLGPLVADALFKRLNAPDGPGVDVAMVASGVIRTNLFTGMTGKQNINDIFNVLPLGSGKDAIPGTPMAKIYVNGAELKKVLELILAVYPSKENYFLYYSGCEVDYNPEKGLFKKISAIRIGNSQTGFKPLDISKKSKQLVSIAANAYMIGFFSQLKKMSFGIVNIQAKNADGSPVVNGDFIVDMDRNKEGVQEVKEWLSFYAFLSGFPDTNGNGIPDVPEEYRTKRNPMRVVK